MRTKDVNNGIISSAANVEEPEGLDSFLESLANQIKAYEESSGTQFAANIVIRTTQDGQEHFIPVGYVRDTKPLCGNLREGHHCSRHSVDDVPQFLNIQDVSGVMNVYHPYDAEHMEVMHGINTGYLGDPDNDPEPTDEFKIVFGELMLKNTPIPDASLLRTGAGTIKFWKGKLQNAAQKAKETASKIMENHPLAQLLNALGLREGQNQALTDEEMAELDKVIAQSVGGEVSDIIDPNDDEAVAKLPPHLQAIAKMAKGKTTQVRFVKMDQEKIDEMKESAAAVSIPMSDLDVSAIADPSKLVKSNKTLH
jgi:hypothetical protein